MAQRAVPHLSHVAQCTPVGERFFYVGLNLRLGPSGPQEEALRETAADPWMEIPARDGMDAVLACIERGQGRTS